MMGNTAHIGELFVVQALACSSAGQACVMGNARDGSGREGAFYPRAHARGYDMSSPAGTAGRTGTYSSFEEASYQHSGACHVLPLLWLLGTETQAKA
jgi:hypothetical protein